MGSGQSLWPTKISTSIAQCVGGGYTLHRAIKHCCDVERGYISTLSIWTTLLKSEEEKLSTQTHEALKVKSPLVQSKHMNS